MSLQRLDLTVDIQNRRLVRSFNANIGVSIPSLYQGDSQDIFLRFVEPTGRTDIPFKEIDPTGWSVKLGIGSIGAVPTSGTFTLTYGADTTSSIAYDAAAATVQTALNALTSITAAGGVTVAGSAGGAWTVTFTSVGVRTMISGTGDALAPSSQVVATQTQAGTASLKEIQRLSLLQQPIAFQDTWSDASSAAVTITELQNGSATQSEVQNIELSQGIYGGSFALSFGNYTTSAISWDATGLDVQTALESLTSIGTDNVSVSGVAGGPWLVSFQGTLANASQNLITAVASGLSTPKGKTAILALNTAGIESALGTSSSISSTFEIEVTPSGSNRMTVLQTTCSIVNDLIEGAPSVPTPTSTYYTVTESDGAYVQNRSTFTGLTGGGSSNLDGLVTTGRSVGQIIEYTVGTASSLYQLKTGTDAESSPEVIRPDDYNASTNAKVWKRLDIYAGQRVTNIASSNTAWLSVSGTPVTQGTVTLSPATSGYIAVKQAGTTIVTAGTALNFSGTAIGSITANATTGQVDIVINAATGAGSGSVTEVRVGSANTAWLDVTGQIPITTAGTVTLTLATSGYQEILKDGARVATGVSFLDFTGAGVTVTANGTTGVSINISSTGGGGGSVQVKDDATNVVTAASVFNFVGNGVTVTADGNTAFISIPNVGTVTSVNLTSSNTAWLAVTGSPLTTAGTVTLTPATSGFIEGQSAGTRVVTGASFINFTGAGVTVTANGTTGINVNIDGAVGSAPAVKSVGTTVVTNASVFNFTGSAVTVTASGNTAYINIVAATGAGSGDMLRANNLSDVNSTTSSRTNIGAAGLNDANTFSQSQIIRVNDQNGLLKLSTTGGDLSGHDYLLMANRNPAPQGAGSFNIYDETIGVNRFHINASGYIGIGTTTATEHLTVSGNVKLSGVAYAGTSAVTLTTTTGNLRGQAIVSAPCDFVIAVSDEATAVTAGTSKITFRMPYSMTVTAARANLNTASTSGHIQVDINEGGASIFSTVLHIDASEKTSQTAVTAAVISDTTLADDAEMTVDIDAAGTGAKGLKIALIGYRSA